MTETSTTSLASALQRILTTPTPDELWRVQAELLAVGTDAALKAREVAGEFHSFLRDLESKVASRSASRMSAILTTASVSSVGLQEMLAEEENPLRRLFASGVTAMLEVAGAMKGVEAWEVEASLVYYDVAWYLYGELWETSLASRPDLSDDDRKTLLDKLLGPALDPDVDATVKSAVLVRFFQIALAARMWPLLRDAGAADSGE
ncbi:MAG TPA: hypothetical protein VMY37_32800 [Thermoguttaceae bacterium]|nr:hypothetical protein [Thermoguttaceae bacterium]